MTVRHNYDDVQVSIRDLATVAERLGTARRDGMIAAYMDAARKNREHPELANWNHALALLLDDMNRAERKREHLLEEIDRVTGVEPLKGHIVP